MGANSLPIAPSGVRTVMLRPSMFALLPATAVRLLLALITTSPYSEPVLERMVLNAAPLFS